MTSSSKSMGARLGHVKRRLKKDGSLTGKYLSLALEVVGGINAGDSQADGIANKLMGDQKLYA